MKKDQQQSFCLIDQLTPYQVKFFNKNGYIHYKRFLPKETVRVIIDEIDRVQDHLIANNINKVNGVSLKFSTDVNGRPVIPKLTFASQFSQKLQALLQDPRLKILMQLSGEYGSRIGENEKEGVVINQYVNTSSDKFCGTGWHTRGISDLFSGSRNSPALDVALHLDDCPLSNGGLRVIPGTHKEGLFGRLFRKKHFLDKSPDKKEVGFDIEAGDVTVHDGRLWQRVQHSSNKGEKSRCRVMYIPIVTGIFRPNKNDNPTPVFHSLGGVNWRKFYGRSEIFNFVKKFSSRNRYLRTR